MTKKVTLKIKPFVLIIRDGWGYNPNPDEDDYNAIKCANTPVDDMLMSEYPNCLIHTSGEDVGLPDGTMGNSEVGHQNIGAGRIAHFSERQYGWQYGYGGVKIIVPLGEGVVKIQGVARGTVNPGGHLG